ncbi:MAG: hypothetical protein WC679_00675 [Bacteroidales bacterium]|jgi:hypothetical protein
MSYTDYLNESCKKENLTESNEVKQVLKTLQSAIDILEKTKLSGAEVRLIENQLEMISDTLDTMINEDQLVEGWITNSEGQKLYKDDETGEIGGSTDAISKLGKNKEKKEPTHHKGKWDGHSKKIETDSGHKYWKSSKQTKDEFISKTKEKHKAKTGKDLVVESTEVELDPRIEHLFTIVGEQINEDIFNLIPKTHQKSIGNKNINSLSTENVISLVLETYDATKSKTPALWKNFDTLIEK